MSTLDVLAICRMPLSWNIILKIVTGTGSMDMG